MSRLDLEAADFDFRCPALRDDTLRVHRFTGREALSEPHEFIIELVSAEPDLDLEVLLGQPARLRLRGLDAGGGRYQRYVHGVIERAVQLAAGARYSLYQVTLGSALRTLALRRDSRIFQGLSAPEVTLAVLREGQALADRVQPLLHCSYAARDYLVQHQESSLDFIRRLWEEEGICFFFEHGEDREVLLLGDGPHAFDSLRGADHLRYRDEPHLYEEGLWELRAESALAPGAATLRDFRFQQPSLDLEARARTEPRGESEMYYFPGGYTELAQGQRLARIRLEEQQCDRQRYCGRSNVRAVVPGARFTLSGHRRRACNQEYLIVAVEHTGVQPRALPDWLPRGSAEPEPGAPKLGYHNRLECIPAGVSFRPPRRTPRPRVAGAQTAVVVGPPGEELHCDEHGRVKVQFPWDRSGSRDERSSCWIRVSQPWAGVGQGAMFLPRVGQEVVVQFLDGDPDRPLINGRVYNGENPTPYPLPAAKTITTLRSASTPGGGGHNELRFDDQKGREELHLHAQRALSVVVGDSHRRQVAGSECCSVGGDRHLTVQRSLCTRVRAGDHTLRVESGSCLTEVKGQCKTTVESGPSELWVLAGGHITKAEGPVTIESGRGRLNLLATGPWHGRSKQKATLEAPELTLRASQKLTLAVGQSTITLDESGIELSAPQITSSAVGTHALTGALITIN